MKKTTTLASLFFLAFSLFGLTNCKDLKTEKPIKKGVTINTTSTYKNPVGPILKKKSSVQPEVFEDFIYDVGSRFTPMKKSAIKKATSLEDFFSWEELRVIEELKFIEIIVIENDRQTEKREISYTKNFTAAQLKLIQSFSYNSHFNIKVEYLEKNSIGQLEHKFNSPHITIVPEQQAEYINGKEALKKLLREKSKQARNIAKVDPLKLQPAKLKFTVTKEGKINNVNLDRSSNYPLVDKTMKELILKTQDLWKPAENKKGEKMDQELVVSFGLIGC